MLLVVCRSRSVEECAINLFKNHIILAEIHWYEQRRTLSNVHPSENSLLYYKKPVTITDKILKKMCWWPHLEIRPARLLIPRGSSTLPPPRYTSISFWRPHLWNKYAHFNIYPESLLAILCKILHPLKEISYRSVLFQ